MVFSLTRSPPSLNTIDDGKNWSRHSVWNLKSLFLFLPNIMLFWVWWGEAKKKMRIRTFVEVWFLSCEFVFVAGFFQWGCLSLRLFVSEGILLLGHPPLRSCSFEVIIFWWSCLYKESLALFGVFRQLKTHLCGVKNATSKTFMHKTAWKPPETSI